MTFYKFNAIQFLIFVACVSVVLTFYTITWLFGSDVGMTSYPLTKVIYGSLSFFLGINLGAVLGGFLHFFISFFMSELKK